MIAHNKMGHIRLLGMKIHNNFVLFIELQQ
jgi:hypothetical protein